MIVTKARDNQLISLTRELALWLMKTPRNGKERGLIVYVDNQLSKSKRFDAEGLERDNPELFEPIPRRYSRTSSSVSLAPLSSQSESIPKRMTPLEQLNGDSSLRRKEENEGQLRYWTNEMCSSSPHLFDFVVTLGGDGTVLYVSWLFRKSFTLIQSLRSITDAKFRSNRENRSANYSNLSRFTRISL